MTSTTTTLEWQSGTLAASGRPAGELATLGQEVAGMGRYRFRDQSPGLGFPGREGADDETGHVRSPLVGIEYAR